MKRTILLAVIALALVPLALSATSCWAPRRASVSMAEHMVMPMPATLPAGDIPAAIVPAQPGDPQPYGYRLPGMDCLVTESGLRRMALITARGIRCLDRVPGGSPTGPELRFFGVYFVFDVLPPKGKVEHYLIGTTPQKNSVLGWISASQAASWDTRVGARYLRSVTRRVPPLVVYAESGALEELIKTGATAAKPIARASLQAEHAWMPWPIAETRSFECNGAVHEFVRLHFLGAKKGQFEVAPKIATTVASDSRYSDEEITSIKGKVKMLDLVVVIDTTQSTSPYISAMRAAVEMIARGLHDLPFRPDVAFGLVEYRDYVPNIMFTDETGKPSVVKVYPLQNDLNAFLQTVRPIQEAQHSSIDFPEAVFDGVQAGLTRVQWRGDALNARVIVLLGDNSAHEPGSPKNPNRISSDDLIGLARQRQKNVKVFSLCVGNRGGEEEQAQHKAQFTHLAEETGGKCYSLAEAGKVIEQIRKILETETAVVKTRSVIVSALAEGKSAEQIIAERYASAQQVTEVMEFLEGAGVEVARLGPGVPAFATGWCLAKVDGVPVVEKEVYVARTELDMLIGELNELCVRLAPSDVHKAFGIGLGARVNPMSFFAQRRPEPLDVYLMAKGVPCSQGLLKLTRSDLDHMSEKDREILREKIARQVLPQVVNARNNESYYTWMDDVEFGWVPESILP